MCLYFHQKKDTDPFKNERDYNPIEGSENESKRKYQED
jgi:hypothetical protein